MERTAALLEESRPFALQINDSRLAMEVAAIQMLAERLIEVLRVRDPLSERVHLSKARHAWVSRLKARPGRRRVGCSVLPRLACARRCGGPDMTQVPEQQTGEQGAAGRAQSSAKGSSFYLAMRILPREQREAMFEIYSFCKAVDDVADTEEISREQRIARLQDWRDRIAALYAGQVPNGLEALAHAVKQFGLRQEDFLAIIDGCEMDAHEDIRAPSYETLDLYCDRVASAVGRLSVRVFGLNEKDGLALAHHLGRALQLTNILRDIDEDADIGRLYLPREALQRAHIEGSDPHAVAANPNLATACAYVVERARHHFKEADAIMARSPRKLVKAPRLMEKAYRKILDGMIARGWARPRTRVRVSKPHLIGIALRYAIV